MRGVKAKRLRRMAESLTVGNPDRKLVLGRNGEAVHLHSTSRAVYLKLKREAKG